MIAYMTLREYLNKQSMTMTEFAKRSGLSQPAIHRYLNGQRQPDLNALRKIIKVTKGKVGINDFAGNE